MKKTRQSLGFSMAEVLVGLIVFGVFAGALLPAVRDLQGLQIAGRRSTRTTALSVPREHLVAFGMDPDRVTPAQLSAPEGVILGAPVHREVWTWSGGTGSARTSLLVAQEQAPGPMLAFGFQIGAGADVPVRGNVLPPLDPIILPAPVLSPTGPALSIDYFSISPGGPGGPWRAEFRAASPGHRVHLRYRGSSPQAVDGQDVALLMLSPWDLATGEEIVAWSEYAGAPADAVELLADGRRRWSVTLPDTRVQVYEPSPSQTYRFRIQIGAPVLAFGATTIPASGGVPIEVTWAMLAGPPVEPAEPPQSRPRLDFPSEVREKFGTSRSPVAFYQTIFEGASGSTIGSLDGIFNVTEEALSRWRPTSRLTVVPRLAGSHLEAEGAAWDFVIVPTELTPPNLSTIEYPTTGSGIYQTQRHSLTAPGLGGGVPGRVRSGGEESTGRRLEVDIPVALP